MFPRICELAPAKASMARDKRAVLFGQAGAKQMRVGERIPRHGILQPGRADSYDVTKVLSVATI
jgi:hypothetical protein